MLSSLWARLRPSSAVDSEPPATPIAVLLEPDPITAALLTDALKSEGFEVHAVRTATEATLRARRKPVDLVLLNGAGSPSIARTIRELRGLAGPDELTLVAVPDPAAADRATELIAAGADDCLTLPLVLSEVRSRIHARLRGRGRSDRRQAESIEPGTVLDGKFRLDEALGSGNFGTVYSAFHLHLERRVAIKVLHDRFSSRDEVIRRLRHEGVSTCQIDHPNAVRVLDLSLTRRGEPFLVMELLEGRSLDIALREAPAGRLTVPEAATILTPVCHVLAESHRVGILHLDIKPGNIFLHAQGDDTIVKVVDFGIVRMVSTHEAEASEIQTRSFEGTPPYASLERLVAEPFGPKADVYSVGVVLYEALTGRRPYLAKTPMHLISLLMREDYPPLATVLPEIPSTVADLCVRCLSADPARRPSAAELADGLAPWARSEGTRSDEAAS